MKRALATLLVSMTLMIGLTAAPAQALDRVRCDFRGSYHITCFNDTPYRVHVRLKLFTTAGVRYRYFTILNYSHSIYSSAYINRITWRWNF